MSLEFVIIPMTKNFENVAFDIKNKLNNSVKLSVTIEIDTNYNNSLQNRITKWKKQEYDIITIDQDFIETNSIVIRFSDKGSKAKTMELEEFIELVSSFEEDENNNSGIDENKNNDTNNNTNDDTNNNTNDDTNDDTNNSNSGCIII